MQLIRPIQKSHLVQESDEFVCTTKKISIYPSKTKNNYLNYKRVKYNMNIELLSMQQKTKFFQQKYNIRNYF